MKEYTRIAMPDSKKKFHWAVSEHQIFEKLDWMPNGEWLIGLLDMLDCDVEILSSTGTHDQSIALQAGIQKGKWLLDHDISFGQNFVNSWSYKQHFARPWSIMIDDRADVIDTFKAKGGLGVLYKDSDWHDMDYKIRQAIVRSKQIIELTLSLEAR
jgi:hypothetical protein